MKTFKQFQEGAIGAALKLGGKALAGYSAYSAGKNLLQGKPKQAGLDAIGVVPGGKVFKGMRTLGAGKNLSKIGSATQSIARYGTDNAFARGVDKVYDKGIEYGGKAINKIKKLRKRMNEEAMAAPTNNVGDGQIAGTVEAGDDPPVKKRKKKGKKKRYIYGGRGSRKMWMK